MFSFLKSKKKRPEYRDIIWMSSDVKYLKLFGFVQEQLTQKTVVIISSFEDTLLKTEKGFKSAGLVAKRIYGLSDLSVGKNLYLMHSDLVLNASSQQKFSIPIHILCMEHYPMPERDENILMKLPEIFNEPQISFFISLEDHLLKPFDSERIIQLMKKLGVDDNEAMEHKMISQSIGRAQKKFAANVSIERKTDSEEEWYKLNYKD